MTEQRTGKLSSGGSRQGGRSPSYPAIPLEAAIRRARSLYEAERQHLTPLDALVKHWNYKSFNGPASVQVAALKKFGLLEDQGSGESRRARVTDRAVTILANPDETIRKQAIREAALAPQVHKELWEQYGPDLPSDDSLRWQLTRERQPPFTERGADEFIAEYRQTIAYALLDDSESAQRDIDGSDAEEDAEYDFPPGPSLTGEPRRRQVFLDTGVLKYAVPVAAGSNVTVEGRFPLSEAEWNQFMAVLHAMKPGLVAERSDQEESEIT